MSDVNINPINTGDVRLAEHSYRRFDVIVPAGYSARELESSGTWANVARNMEMGDEIRVVAEDYSFVAYLLVTYCQGGRIKTKVIGGADLDIVDQDADEDDQFEVKMRGRAKWCIIDKASAKVIKSGIATKAVAYKELDDHKRALAA